MVRYGLSSTWLDMVACYDDDTCTCSVYYILLSLSCDSFEITVNEKVMLCTICVYDSNSSAKPEHGKCKHWK